MKKHTIIMMAAFLLLTMQVRPLIGQNWGLGLRVGTGGIGLDISRLVTTDLAIRAGYSMVVIPFAIVQEIGGYELEADARVSLGGAVLLADYYPGAGHLRLSGGLLLNQMNMAVGLHSLSSFKRGDMLIPAADVGNISATLKPSLFSGYFAMGYGSPLSYKKRVTFQADFGIVYHGKPEISLSGEGLIGPMANEMNQMLINQYLAQYKWCPVLNLGVMINFSKL